MLNRTHFLFFIIVAIACLAACESETKEPFLRPPIVQLDFRADTTLREVRAVKDTLDSAIMEIEDILDSLRENELDTTEFSELLNELLPVQDTLNEYFDILNSQSVILRDVFAINGKNDIFIDDSVVNILILPLDMNSDTSQVIISYDRSLEDTITVFYKRLVEEEFTEVFVRANNLSLDTPRTTFDSIVGPICATPKCNSNETSFIIYY